MSSGAATRRPFSSLAIRANAAGFDTPRACSSRWRRRTNCSVVSERYASTSSTIRAACARASGVVRSRWSSSGSRASLASIARRSSVLSGLDGKNPARNRARSGQFAVRDRLRAWTARSSTGGVSRSSDAACGACRSPSSCRSGSPRRCWWRRCTARSPRRCCWLAGCSSTCRRAESRFAVVPCLNPDGVLAGTRQNAAGVDINRNFPAESWRAGESFTFPPGCLDRRLANRTNRSTTGEAAGSEPETRAIVALVRELRPRVVVDLHSPLALVLCRDGLGRELAGALAERAGFEVHETLGLEDARDARRLVRRRGHRLGGLRGRARRAAGALRAPPAPARGPRQGRARPALSGPAGL